MNTTFFNSTLLFLVIMTASCCDKEDTIMPDGTLDEQIHELIIEQVTKRDSMKLPIFSDADEKVFIEFDSFIRANNFSYFSQPDIVDSFFEAKGINFIANNFDFQRFVLVPVYNLTYTEASFTEIEFQVKCFINHKENAINIFVNKKYKKCGPLGLEKENILFFHWYEVPTLPAGYTLKVH